MVAEVPFEVRIKKPVLRRLGKLPQRVRDKFYFLIQDLRDKGPILKDWPNFSSLGMDKYHCHLAYSLVACWRHEKGTLEIEIYYAGSLSLKHVRPSTMRDYRQTFASVFTPAFGEKLLDEIELKDVERFLKTWHKRKGEITARTKQKYLTELRAFFRWAIRHGYGALDQTDGVKIKGISKEQGVALTPDEARALLTACQTPIIRDVKYSNRAGATQEFQPPSHLLVAVLIALHTGLRRGNVVGLKWWNIDLEKRKITIPGSEMKAHNDFEVSIHPELCQILRQLLKGRTKIDPDEHVLGRSFTEIKKSFKSALKRAGLSPDIRWHDLRHSFATWIGQRATFVVYRALLGHSPGSVSERYFHPPFEELRKVIDSLPHLLSHKPAADTMLARR
ncbi:MAG: site-specific integrase [Planctomycetes bacterium]|nr:site-specific integrase [Planctomycetota bacterium]